jgi:hypothetical protein
VSSGSSSVFSRIFTVAEIDVVDDNEPGDTTTAEVQTIFVVFLHMSLKSAHLSDVFYWQKTLPILGLLSSSARLSGFSNCGMSD